MPTLGDYFDKDHCIKKGDFLREWYEGYLGRKSSVQKSRRRIDLYFHRLEERMEIGCGHQRS